MALFPYLLDLTLCDIFSPKFIVLVVLLVVIPFPSPLQIVFYASKSFIIYIFVPREGLEPSTP